MSTAKMPLSAARAALVIALAALLVWAAMRMVIGVAVAVPAASAGQHQGSPIVAPAAPAAAAQEPSVPAPAVGAAPTSLHQTTPVQQQPPSECLLTGTNAPSKSYVRGGCPAQ